MGSSYSTNYSTKEECETKEKTTCAVKADSKWNKKTGAHMELFFQS